MVSGRRARRLGLAAIFYFFACAATSAAAAEQPTAERLSVIVGRPRMVPMADVGAVVSVNDGLVEAAPSEGGFTVLGRAVGDTIVQVFTTTALRVYIVVVEPPPPSPPGPPRPASLAEVGPVRSFWADNRYQIRYNRSSLTGSYFNHSLSFHGRTGPGEYRAVGEFINGDAGSYFQRGTVSWTSDKRDLAFDVGDTAARLFGATMAGGVGIRGLRAKRSYRLRDERGAWSYELFTGELLNMGDPRGTKLTQPSVGGSLETSFSPEQMRDLRITLGSSALVYSTARQSGTNAGQTGIILGAVARAIRQNGFGFELRSAVSSATEHVAGAPRRNAATFGALGLYQTDKGSQRLEYETVQDGFAAPQTGYRQPGFQRASASFSRTLLGITGTGSAAYGQYRDVYGNSLAAISYRFGTVIPVHRQTTFTLMAGESTMPTTLVLPGGGHELSAWTQSTVGARLDHTTLDGRYGIQSELNVLDTESPQSSAMGTTALLSVQRRRVEGSRWDGMANLTVSAAQSKPHPAPNSTTSVLAVDQSPLNFGVAGSVQGRFVQDPYQVVGGLSLQTIEMPKFQIAPTVNLGIQFTPTSAHQLVANFSVSRWPQGGRTLFNTAINYTYRFGDAVRAVPIFEFMSYGVVEGRVCFDENTDGLCTTDEAPLPNVPLRLSNGQRTVSDSEGHYRFSRVKPGYYHLEVDEAAMRDRGRPTTILAAAFELPVRGEERRHFAVARACRIQGQVIHDLNLDGAGAESEPLFAGPLVIATGAAGAFQARVNNLGTFTAILPCGEYDLELDPASLPTLHSPGSDEPVHVATSATDIASPKLLVTAIRTIGGEVFLDRNGNGTKEKDEPVVADAKVRLGERAGSTDETGAFLLRHLPAGKDHLSVDPASLPAGMRPGPAIPFDLPAQATALEDVRVPVLPAK